jgi:hypothetical protein
MSKILGQSKANNAAGCLEGVKIRLQRTRRGFILGLGTSIQ